MKYIITDPNDQSHMNLKEILDGNIILDFQGSFNTLKETENSILEEPPDIAFIRMGNAELNAYRLASMVRELNPFSKVIFFSSNESYAVEAFECGADGFLLIPFNVEKIENLLKRWMQK